MPKKNPAAHDYLYECYVTNCPAGGKTFSRLGNFKLKHPECIKFGWAPLPARNKCYKRKINKAGNKKDGQSQSDYSSISGEFISDCLNMTESQKKIFKTWLAELLAEHLYFNEPKPSTSARERTLSDLSNFGSPKKGETFALH